MESTTANIIALLEKLDDDIDDLDDSIAPVLDTSISDAASKLPILDKAKLYVLTTYAIESILFSYLRLNGIKAREHPVFKELTRCKQYFEKVKSGETPASRPQELTVDKKAAARFIKAGLVGNNRLDLQQAERQAKEKVRAYLKVEETSYKQAPLGKMSQQDELAESSASDASSSSIDNSDSLASKKRKADAITSDTHIPSDSQSSSVKADSVDVKLKSKRKKSKSAKNKNKKSNAKNA